MFIFRDLISLTYCLGLYLFNRNNNELILLYHSIGNIDRQNDPYKINLCPFLFEKQIEFLYSHYKQAFLITFDDGLDNFFYHAFPIILRYNIRSILFVNTDFIDGKISFDWLFANNLKPLTWKQIKEIAGAGVEIGSHSLSHTNLREVDSRQAYREIHDSKIRIEDMIGKEVKYFAYPYGSRNAYNERLKEMVKECGYEKAYTNIMGFNKIDSDPYELRRIRIYNNDNMFRFKIKIKGGYNWIDHLNYPCFKNVK